MLSTNIHFQFSRFDPVDFVARPHTHKCYELIYYYSGCGCCRLGDRAWEYNAGDYVLVPPDMLHDDNHREPCRLYCIGFSIARGDSDLPCGVFSDRGGRIRRYLDLIGAEFKSRQMEYISVAHNCLNNAIVEILRANSPAVSVSSSTDVIERAINYMNQNFNTEITPQTLAEITNYSYDRFRHIFRHAMGISPQKYIFDKRMETAKRMLSSTSLSVTEIAQKCGFTSPSLFSKQFKEKTDLSPSQFRKQFFAEKTFTDTQSNYDG